MSKKQPQKHLKERLVTPTGAAGFLHLAKEDPRYGGYKAEIRLSPEKGKKLVQKIDKMAEEVFGEKAAARGNLPYIEDDETGEIVFRTKSKFPIPVFDAKGNKLSLKKVRVGSGSKLRLAVELRTYWQSSKVYGVKAYPQGVQVISLVEFGGGGADMFKSSQEDLEEELEDGEEIFVYEGGDDAGDDDDDEDTPFNGSGDDEDDDDADF